jgi:hypothetical protein
MFRRIGNRLANTRNFVDKMNKVDGLLLGHDAVVDRYMLMKPGPLGPTRRTAIFLVNVAGERSSILFAWDEGGTLCVMQPVSRSSSDISAE